MNMPGQQEETIGVTWQHCTLHWVLALGMAAQWLLRLLPGGQMSFRHKVTSTSIGDHEVMVIGKGNIVDQSLVEVVHAVVEVRDKYELSKDVSRCTDSLACSATVWQWQCPQSRPSPNISPCPLWSEWSPGELVTGWTFLRCLLSILYLSSTQHTK